MKNGFDEKLHDWSNKAALFCRSVIEDPDYEIDLFFYAFQSPPLSNPDLLILGLNPHENGTYKDGCSAWGIKEMTALEMMKENQFWLKKEGIKGREGHESWNIWRKLRKLFRENELKLILDSSVYMNLIYFNTNNFDEFINKKGSNKVITKCKELTTDVIFNVIKPKSILCLSIPKCFDYIKGESLENLLPGGKKRLLMKKMINGVPVYGVPHVSGSRISNKEFDEIREMLRNELLPK